MVDIVKMLSYKKGDGCTYRPVSGEKCLISPPHADDENGYTYGEYEVLWTDAIFILYRKDGCWPAVNKWEHIRTKPLALAAE